MPPACPNAAVRILLIEDETELALDLCDLLRAEGYVVAGVASSGPQALALFQDCPVDLVLCDIGIQGPWDGIETVTRLGAGCRVPVIYLSASADRSIRERAIQTLPSAYLLKPVTPDSLRVAIELALALHRPGSQVARSPARPAGEAVALGPEPILRLGATVFIRQNCQFVRVRLADILLLQADSNHTLLITAGHKYALRLYLSHVLDRLASHQLVRVHQSHAVNIDHIQSFTNQELHVTGYTVPMGRQYRDDFLRRFNY